MKYLVLILVILSLFSCEPKEKQKQKVEIDLQGHRGARGLLPENSIPAFLKALEFDKVTTLELDLAVTKDMKLIVSHEPWFNPVICTDSLGNDLDEEAKISIYQLTYQEIQSFDCGSKGNPRFPDQQKIKTIKPLLSDVINAVSKELKRQGCQGIHYNIEIKSDPELDDIYTPSPQEFSDLVYTFIKENIGLDKATIQSFDFRV